MLSTHFDNLHRYLTSQIIGQPVLIKQLLIALLADGHVLIEGPPGLAKTRTVKTLAHCIQCDFQRIQFTPDLLPADITGSDIYRPELGEFHFQSGPLFHSLILADEINRAPAKVQAAMLEAMAEKQISIGKTTHCLPPLFFVIATQNPIEQEGTYTLPEAQLDRFLLQLNVSYPNEEDELSILRLNQTERENTQPLMPDFSITFDDIFTARTAVDQIYIAPEIEQYIVRLVMATREPERYDSQLSQWLKMGVSPRASLALNQCARARAWLEGREFVIPEDIQIMAYPVLRHRLILNYEAIAENIHPDHIIRLLISQVTCA